MSATLDTLNFSVFEQFEAALLAECVSAHNEQFRYVFGLIIFVKASGAIHVDKL
jgi:hypothetical protein